MSGTMAREPVATRIRGAVRRRPSTSTTRRRTNLAVPRISSRLGVPVARYSSPPAVIGSIRPKTRSRMAGQSAPLNEVSTPRRWPWRAASATSAGRTNIFDGMQPTFRHVPPKVPRSIRAIRQSASSAGMELPEPVPMMIRSKLSMPVLSVSRTLPAVGGRWFTDR